MSKKLKEAIEKNDAELVKAVAKGVKDFSRKLPGAPVAPVAYACQIGAESALAALLDAGAEVKAREGFIGEHPFVVAAEKDRRAVMEVLVERKAVPDEAMQRTLSDCGRGGKLEQLKFLLGKFKPAVGATAIRFAVYSRKPEVIQLMTEHGVDFNAQGDEGGLMTRPLHSAVSVEAVEIVEAMVKGGADVNGRDGLGRTPLMVAASGAPDNDRQIARYKEIKGVAPEGPGADAIIRKLLELGADATLKDNEGHDAMDHYRYEAGRIRQPENPGIIEILKNAGAKGDAATYDLFIAPDLAAMQRAIESGADVNRIAPPPWDITAMTRAIWDGSVEKVELLVKSGADVNKADPKGTPLTHAAEKGQLAIVKKLIELGADPGKLEPRAIASDMPRMNATMKAEWAGHKEVAKYLKSIGGHRVTEWKPIEAGVHSWEDFSEIVAEGDVQVVARALAKMIKGKVEDGSYGKEMKVGKMAFIVARPKGMKWCNVIQIAPERKRFGEEKKMEKFCAELAESSGGAVMLLQYSDTSDAAAVGRFEADGSNSQDQGWDEDTLKEAMDAMGDEAPAWMKKKLRELKDKLPSAQRLEKMAEEEKFAIGVLYLSGDVSKKVELQFVGYPEEAFDGVAFVSD